MGSFDTITWQALTAVLTLAGLVGSVAFWRLRGPVAGLRVLALALLPAAAYLTGTLRLLWEVGDAVVSWALRLTFNPTMWLGVVLAVTSALVFMLAGLLRRRPGRASRQSPETLEAGRSRRPADPVGGSGKAEGDDMTDIEAILRRHGIS